MALRANVGGEPMGTAGGDLASNSQSGDMSSAADPFFSQAQSLSADHARQESADSGLGKCG